MSLDTFWEAIEKQLEELKMAKTADEVLAILALERNPYGPGVGSGHAFFAGGGGDETPADPLLDNGWRVIWWDAPYYYALQAPDGSSITYVEGDVYRGDSRAAKEADEGGGGITPEGLALGHRYVMGNVNAYCPKCTDEQGVAVLDCDYDLDK